jgi:hypothetical protein
MRALLTRVFGASIAGRSGLQLVDPCQSSKITRRLSSAFFGHVLSALHVSVNQLTEYFFYPFIRP